MKAEISKEIEKLFEEEVNRKRQVLHKSINETKKYMFKEFKDYMNFEHMKAKGEYIEDDCNGGLETKLGLFTNIILYPKTNEMFYHAMVHFDGGGFDGGVNEPGHFGKLWQMIGKDLDEQAKLFKYDEGKKFGEYTGELIGKSTSNDINDEIVEMINKVKQSGHWVIYNKNFGDDYKARFAVFLGPFETSIGTIEYLKFAFENVDDILMAKLQIGVSTKQLFQK